MAMVIMSCYLGAGKALCTESFIKSQSIDGNDTYLERVYVRCRLRWRFQ